MRFNVLAGSELAGLCQLVTTAGALSKIQLDKEQGADEFARAVRTLSELTDVTTMIRDRALIELLQVPDEQRPTGLRSPHQISVTCHLPPTLIERMAGAAATRKVCGNSPQRADS